MDRKSSAGMLKTVHLAVDWHHSESPPHGRSAVEWLVEYGLPAPQVNIRSEFEKCKPRWTIALTVGGFRLGTNGASEKSGGDGGEGTCRGGDANEG